MGSYSRQMKTLSKPLISSHGLWSLLMIVFIAVIVLSSSGCRSSGHVTATNEAACIAETVRSVTHGLEAVTNQLQLEGTMQQVTWKNPTWTVVNLAMADSVWIQMPAGSAMLASDSLRSVQLRVGKDKEGQIAAEASVIRMEGSTHKEIGLVLAQTAEKTEDQSCGQSTQVEVKHTATEENSPVKNRGKPKAWHWYVLLALLGIVVLWYGGLKTVGRALKR